MLNKRVFIVAFSWFFLCFTCPVDGKDLLEDEGMKIGYQVWISS